MSNKINFIMYKLFKTGSVREKFIKNKNNYNKFLIKNNQQNYNKIITRKNHTYSFCLSGGPGPRKNRPNIFAFLCLISAYGISKFMYSSDKKK